MAGGGCGGAMLRREAERCPRCESRDTKFCYYNNYNTSQPRHFCKSCRRYWTLGGALRNVPIGGSSRKRPRPTSPPTPPPQTTKSLRILHHHHHPPTPFFSAAASASAGENFFSGVAAGLFGFGVSQQFELGLGLGLGHHCTTVAEGGVGEIEAGLNFGVVNEGIAWPSMMIVEDEQEKFSRDLHGRDWFSPPVMTAATPATVSSPTTRRTSGGGSSLH